MNGPFQRKIRRCIFKHASGMQRPAPCSSLMIPGSPCAGPVIVIYSAVGRIASGSPCKTANAVPGTGVCCLLPACVLSAFPAVYLLFMVPMSFLYCMPSKFMRAMLSYAFARASSCVSPRAVTPSTLPPDVSITDVFMSQSSAHDELALLVAAGISA